MHGTSSIVMSFQLKLCQLSPGLDFICIQRFSSLNPPKFEFQLKLCQSPGKGVKFWRVLGAGGLIWINPPTSYKKSAIGGLIFGGVAPPPSMMFSVLLFAHFLTTFIILLLFNNSLLPIELPIAM